VANNIYTAILDLLEQELVSCSCISCAICKSCSKQLTKLAYASPKELRAAVSKNKGDRNSCCYPPQFSEINTVNQFSAAVCSDPLYSKEHVQCFVRKPMSVMFLTSSFMIMK